MELTDYQKNYMKSCILKDLEVEMETHSRLKSLGVRVAMKGSRREDSDFDKRGSKDLEDDGPRPFTHDISSVMRQARAGDPDGTYNNDVGSWN